MTIIIARSCLYSLEPCSGASGWESITSYISRLAHEHCLSTQDVIHQILYKLEEKDEYWQRREYSSILFLLNGMGHLSQRWIDVLETLTGLKILRTLTLLNWEGVIRSAGLLRKHKAWCPICLNEQQASNKRVYEPLLWFLAQNTACPCHEIYLSQKCPNDKCKRQIPVLGSKSQPGYCSYCGTWLGESQVQQQIVTPREIWISRNLQEMMLCNENPANKLVEVQDHRGLSIFDQNGLFFQLDSKTLASVFGTHPTTINRWKRGEKTDLSVLLEGCYLLQQSPFSSVWQVTDECKFTNFVIYSVLPNSSETNLLNLYKNDKSGFWYKYGAMLVTSKSTYEFYRRAKARHFVIQAKSPELHSFISSQIEQDRMKTQNQIDSILEEYLTCQDTPLPLNQIVENLGIPIRTLRRYAPDLCKKIAKQRIEFESRNAKQKEAELIEKVYQEAWKHLDIGEYPSTNLIAAHLPHQAYIMNPNIRNSIKKAVSDFRVAVRKHLADVEF